MAGNEVEDCNNARNPADEDDGNSSNKCVPRVVFVQRLLNDHVDALQEISDSVPEPSDENVDEDDFEDDEDSKRRRGSTSVNLVGGKGPAGSSVLGEAGVPTLPCDHI